METKAGVVVDPGGDIDRILATLSESGIAVGEIWLTHGHLDHAGGAMDLEERLGVELVGPHEADRPLLANLENQAQSFGITEPVRNCTPDRFLAEGDMLSIGEHGSRFCIAPAMPPAMSSTTTEQASFAHVGDVLFQRLDRPHRSAGRRPRDAAQLDQGQAAALGDDIGFICGHGPGGRFGEERRNNPFLVSR